MDATGRGSASLSWPAPAKLNLFLHVTGRKPDGYHLLQTVFQFLDFTDELDFIPRQDSGISLTGNYDGIEPDQDLIMRAAKLLQEKCMHDRGVDISVRKKLPLGGGLGGGSSNAATTLVALNWLWGVDMEPAELAVLGLGLGADVPVFVHGYAAWAEGVGERLTPIDLPEEWYAVVSPGINVSTARVFNSPDLTRNTPAITIRDFLAGNGRNDCENAVQAAYPEVAELLNWMNQRAPARLTGTGACVFCSFSTEKMARELLAELPEKWWGFVARGRNRSPLLSMLDRVKRVGIG